MHCDGGRALGPEKLCILLQTCLELFAKGEKGLKGVRGRGRRWGRGRKEMGEGGRRKGEK